VLALQDGFHVQVGVVERVDALGAQPSLQGASLGQ
jgi:hypothetical protein